MEEYLMQNQYLILLITIWTLPWKGYALWIAAKKKQKIWFIVLLTLNTLAILEILYIFIFSKQNKKIDDTKK